MEAVQRNDYEEIVRIVTRVLENAESERLQTIILAFGKLPAIPVLVNEAAEYLNSGNDNALKAYHPRILAWAGMQLEEEHLEAKRLKPIRSAGEKGREALRSKRKEQHAAICKVYKEIRVQKKERKEASIYALVRADLRIQELYENLEGELQPKKPSDSTICRALQSLKKKSLVKPV
ncbi:MAG: hypothetical protein ACHQAX_09335 [Gammaproteobacteria bacterium]